MVITRAACSEGLTRAPAAARPTKLCPVCPAPAGKRHHREQPDVSQRRVVSPGARCESSDRVRVCENDGIARMRRRCRCLGSRRFSSSAELAWQKRLLLPLKHTEAWEKMPVIISEVQSILLLLIAYCHHKPYEHNHTKKQFSRFLIVVTEMIFH